MMYFSTVSRNSPFAAGRSTKGNLLADLKNVSTSLSAGWQFAMCFFMTLLALVDSPEEAQLQVSES
jgi:hypothetical protein